MSSKKNTVELPLVPLDDIVLFPHMLIPVFIDDDACIQAIEDKLKNSKTVFFSAYKNNDNTMTVNVYDVGLICTIIRTRMLPDGRMRVLIKGDSRAQIDSIVRTEPYPIVRLRKIADTQVNKTQAEVLVKSIRKALETVASLGKVFPPDFLAMLDEVDDPSRMADIIAANLGFKIEQAQKILAMNNAVDRLHALQNFLQQEIDFFRMQAKIQSQACDKIGKAQKENYLREQIKILKDELHDGDGKDDNAELWRQIKTLPLSSEAKQEAARNMRRLEKMHQDGSEASLIRSYLDHLLSLPWGKFTDDNLELKNAKAVLDEDHFGLHEIKDRIIEHLAVKKLNPDATSPILCFVGPPGVGKTSLGRSIARAMGRKFARVSLGGVRDEADIRGHRRTYVGAYPGRLIQSLRVAETMNPIIMLDEIDKIGADHRGNPAAALLEMLDPEQNASFVDHYLGVSFDFSQVLFITNANTVSTVSPALLDRLEIINLSGYSVDEKVAIATQFLIPRQLLASGLNNSGVQVSFSKPAIAKIVNDYTKESGLRTLEKKIASICRKFARKVVETSSADKLIRITPRIVKKQLGSGYISDFSYQKSRTGVALALAYTPISGEVIAIECNIIRNNKAHLKLTGQIGKVMDESAHAALSFVVSNADYFGIDATLLTSNEVHVHIPAAAVPKDGPSAGVSITTAIISAALDITAKQVVAMTGEITLHGHVLAIGGLKEKLLAAQRYQIDTVVVPKRNYSEVRELVASVRKNLKIYYFENYFSIFKLLFCRDAQAEDSPPKEASLS
ncbi:MAG: endopeptidase La [Pseudomonadota bacterium]|nr:endopeptidase La [Pseudomonadota bacterium]